jgi:hypothetical protein
MATAIMGDADAAVMYCNTTNMAFGPVHTSIHGDARAELREYVTYVHDRFGDPRKVSPASHATHLHEFLTDEEFKSAMWGEV